MMKIRIITTAILSFLFIFTCVAQIDRSQRPEPGPAPVINIPTAEKFQLPNGLIVIVVENDKLPRVTYNLMLAHDPIHEGEYAGYRSLAGQMLRMGTKAQSKEEIDEAIDFIGANVTTHGGGIFASALSRHNKTLLELISDILLKPSFPEQEFERLKNRTLSNIASQKTSATYMMGLMQSRVVYGEEHPFGVSETEETIANITLDKCKEFYNDFFRPNAAYLVIIGDVNIKEIKPQIEKYFGKWEKKPVQTFEYDEVLPPDQRRVYMIDRPLAVQSSIRVSYAIDHKPNDKDRITASLMNTILGDGFFRLNENLREKHGYTYGAYSSLGRNNLIASFNINTEVGLDVTAGAVQEILNEMYRIVLEPVSEEELQTAKNYLTGTFALRLAEPRTIANFALEVERYGLPEDYFVNYLKNLEAITSEDLQRVAARYILPENCNILIVSKADETAESLKQFAMDGKIHFYDQNGMPVVESEAIEIPAGLTADVVVEKYFEAIGGRKNIEKVKDFKQVQKTSMMGQEIVITNYQMEPHYLLSETAMGGMVMSKQLFDGERIVVTSPMGRQEFTEGPVFESVKKQAVFNAEIKYKELGIEKSLVGVEKVDGKDAYKIEVNNPDGTKGFQFYDVSSGLKLRSMVDNNITTFGDYKKFGDVMFPTKISQEAGPQFFEIKVESVEVNTGLTKEIFVIE